MSRPRELRRFAAYAVLIALTLLASAACSGDDEQAPDSADDPATVVLDGDWTLSDATGLTLDEGNPITMTVDGDRVSGSSACNRFMGALKVSGDTVAFGPLGGTEMACSPASVMQLEQAFLAALQSAETARLENNTLTLTGPDSTLTFVTTAPAVDVPIVGTSWRLESLTQGKGNNGSATSVSGGPATLVLAEDGSLTGSTGVNTLTGRWAEDSEELRITDVGSTRIGSTGAEARQEAQILAVLGGDPTVQVNGDVLTLRIKSGKGLVYREQ